MNFDERIAIIDWTHLIEDYLDNIGLTFEEFKNEMTGGWLFGYLEALQKVGFKPTFFCFSAQQNNLGAHLHLKTSSELCVLPAPRIYRLLRTRVLNPYTENLDEAVENLTAFNRPLYSLLLSAAEYISTPFLNLHQELARRKINRLIVQDYEHGRFDSLVLLSKLTRRNIFSSFQGGFPTSNKLKSRLRKFAVNSADGIICGSGAEIERLKKDYGISQRRIAKIFNPLETEGQKNPDQTLARKRFGILAKTRVAVWHGRIDLRRKGLDLLIEAWQKLCTKQFSFPVKLLLLGDGNEAHEFRRLLDSANNPTIKWFDEYTNDRQRIKEFLSLGDVYVFPSRHEGFPVAPIEAMSLGLPLLATKANGISDILESGEQSGGIAVELEDVEALTENLEKLFTDETWRLKLGEKARQRAVEAFSLEKAGIQLKEFLTGNVK